MKPTGKPAYIAIQAKFKCQCERPFKKKGICGKCKKRLRN